MIKRISFIALAGMMALSVAPAQAAAVQPSAVLLGTPWWVYAVFGLLLYNGLTLTKTRSVPLWRLLTQPAIFIAWGAVSLALAAPVQPILALDWLVLAVAGAGLSLATSQASAWPMERARGVIVMPGSYLPLMRSLVIFAAKYALGVAVALRLASPGGLRLLDMAVSGASAGYFAAWAIQLALAYRRRPVVRLNSTAEGVKS